VLKPDLAAPGTVVSAESQGSYFSINYPARHVAGSGSGAYMALAGTSMAAAVVSGAAALVVESTLVGGPELLPSGARIVLQLSASFVATAGLVGAGAGSLNVPAAITLVTTHQLMPDVIDHIWATPSGIAFALPGDPGLTSVHQGQTGWDSAQIFSSAIVWDPNIVWNSAVADASNSTRDLARSGQPIAWDTASVQSHAGIWNGAVWGSSFVEDPSTPSSTIAWDIVFDNP
jgi:serine protease AprX